MMILGQIYQGIVLYSEEELKTITKNLEKVDKKLASKGIHFLLYVPPLETSNAISEDTCLKI